MNKNMPAILISVFTALIVIGILIFAIKSPSSSTNSNSTSTSSLAKGDKEIDFTLKDTTNTPVTLSSFKGKSPVLLEFFAVWCPHCQNMAPIIDSLYSKYNSKGIQFLDIQASPYGKNYESSGGSDTTPATVSDLNWFKSNFNVAFPILQDPNTTQATAYGIQGFPTIMIINKSGKVAYESQGEVAQSTLDNALSAVI